ncbi:MAG: hypothetical protein LBU73_01820 [Helicobacteraceae bacterium]|jgi:hypothetical protein|nr:hypothetical protein [Helicobacteraceae bacterium]
MTIFQKLEAFVLKTFKTTLEVFLAALKMSPNAQGYVNGSITELLLKQHLENLDYEVKRIREKWEGKKHSNHHGDFYFRKNDTNEWFVLESKGVKSNSEKWHKLYNYDNLKKFLYAHSEKLPWIDKSQDIEKQNIDWITANLPKFLNEYKESLYDYEEIQKYNKQNRTRETDKSRAITALSVYSRDEIGDMINERLEYLMSKIRVLETHFVSGVSGSSERTQATPRKNEFNAISIDIVLRFDEHKFVFANPNQLESSGEDAEHLQQNYIMGFVFPQTDGSLKLGLTDEWFDNFADVYATLLTENAVNEYDMQIDNRNLIIDG